MGEWYVWYLSEEKLAQTCSSSTFSTSHQQLMISSSLLLTLRTRTHLDQTVALLTGSRQR